MSALDRLRARRRQLSPLLAGLVVALVAGLALTVTHHSPRPVVPPRTAIAAALRDPRLQQVLAGSHWTRIETHPIDARLEQVSFWAGAQIVAEAAVDRSARVSAAADHHRQRVPYGDWLAYQPVLLAGLSLVFLLATMVTPWRRMRNLDALAALSLVGSIVLFQRRYLDASLIAAAPGLIYLMARCAWKGIGGEGPGGPAMPVLAALMARLPAERRVRALRLALVVVALIFAMIGVSSPDAVDVTYAVMEGATNLIHGVLPYGHMPPGIVHGDTYPILSYALYAPLALVAPVRSLWYPVDLALALAVLAAFGAAWAALRCRAAETEEVGLRAALAVLSFPAFMISTSTGTTDVLMAGMLVAALVLWRRPGTGAGMLALAGWFKLAPFALVPVFLAPLRGRRLMRALAAIALVSLSAIVLVVGIGGTGGLAAMARAVAYQFTRGSLQSIWSALGIEPVQPLAQASVLGLIAVACVTLRREPRLARDRTRIAALAAAILIGLQLVADYWAFLYVVWFVPFVCVALFGSELAPARAPAPATIAGEASALPAPDPVPA
jgi:hypothetical protein